MSNRSPLLLAACASALLGSCLPTETCACPPSRTHAVVYGTVQTAAASPAPGARVTATVYAPVCGEGYAERDEGATASADAAGAYRVHFYSVSGPRAACVRLSARAPGAADSTVVDVAVALGPDRSPPDSVRVDLALP